MPNPSRATLDRNLVLRLAAIDPRFADAQMFETLETFRRRHSGDRAAWVAERGHALRVLAAGLRASQLALRGQMTGGDEAVIDAAVAALTDEVGIGDASAGTYAVIDGPDDVAVTAEVPGVGTLRALFDTVEVEGCTAHVAVGAFERSAPQ